MHPASLKRNLCPSFWPCISTRARPAVKALLLTGTGVTNQAALHACGLNAEEAKRHLRQAVASGEDEVAAPAAEALEWCEMEVRGLGRDMLYVPLCFYDTYSVVDTSTTGKERLHVVVGQWQGGTVGNNSSSNLASFVLFCCGAFFGRA